MLLEKKLTVIKNYFRPVAQNVFRLVFRTWHGEYIAKVCVSVCVWILTTITYRYTETEEQGT